jgi:hypothetical protein
MPVPAGDSAREHPSRLSHDLPFVSLSCFPMVPQTRNRHHLLACRHVVADQQKARRRRSLALIVAGLRSGPARSCSCWLHSGGAGLTVKAFRMPICACWLVERFGVPTGEVTPARLSYHLTKRRSKGVL